MCLVDILLAAWPRASAFGYRLAPMAARLRASDSLPVVVVVLGADPACTGVFVAWDVIEKHVCIHQRCMHTFICLPHSAMIVFLGS